MQLNFVQANLNRSKQALDLLLQYTKETNIGILLVSEPNYVPVAPSWFSSKDGSAAIYCDAKITRMRCRLASQGTKYVAIHCEAYLIISIYISSNLGLRDYNASLDELSIALGNRTNLIILGDFNAKSSLWGSAYTDGRGFLLTSWTAERDLRVLNTGNTPTCVRPQGSSIIDISWSSPDLLPFVSAWRGEGNRNSLRS